MNSVLGRFRESRLAEWLIAYLAFAWLTVQIVDVIAEVWDISDVLQRRVHVGLAFGVPATAVLAWFHGEQGKQRVTRSELFILAALAGLASLALPSVGAAGIEPVFGIPATVVVPCTLVTMVLIPISLIIVSVRITQKHRPGIAPEEPEEALSEQEKKLWDDLLSATTQAVMGSGPMSTSCI